MNRFISLTEQDRCDMLAAIGVDSIEQLFADIPEHLRVNGTAAQTEPESELTLDRAFRQLAAKNRSADHLTCFLGAGCYDHFIPSLVDHVISRQEFYTAYTPYQPEISQGLLQAIFEYQSMICELTGMDVSNASLYDGATAVAEAVLIACQATRRDEVIYSRGLHPDSQAVLQTYARLNRYSLKEWPLASGQADLQQLERLLSEKTAAVVIQNPNFFGVIEDVQELTERIHNRGAYCIASINPLAAAVLEAPGNLGVDLVVGDGQPLGNPMNFGGPSLGFLAAGEKDLRRLPGRIVGETEDRLGRRGYVLTMQTREQHIRREKATSNICSNQALNALAASVYLASMGKEGFQDAARQSCAKAHYAQEQLIRTGEFEMFFEAPFFHEFALRSKRPPRQLNRKLLETGVIGGLELDRFFPELQHGWLLAVTEKRTRAEIDLLVEKVVAE